MSKVNGLNYIWFRGKGTFKLQDIKIKNSILTIIKVKPVFITSYLLNYSQSIHWLYIAAYQIHVCIKNFLSKRHIRLSRAILAVHVNIAVWTILLTPTAIHITASAIAFSKSQKPSSTSPFSSLWLIMEEPNKLSLDYVKMRFGTSWLIFP